MVSDQDLLFCSAAGIQANSRRRANALYPQMLHLTQDRDGNVYEKCKWHTNEQIQWPGGKM